MDYATYLSIGSLDIEKLSLMTLSQEMRKESEIDSGLWDVTKGDA